MSLPTGSLIAVGLFGLGVYTGVRLAQSNQRIDSLIAQALDRRISRFPNSSAPTTDWVHDEWWKN